VVPVLMERYWRNGFAPLKTIIGSVSCEYQVKKTSLSPGVKRAQCGDAVAWAIALEKA